MRNSEHVEYIDVTPTWESLLMFYLHSYVAMDGKKDARERRGGMKNIEEELTRMARGADKWVTFVKEGEGVIKDALDKSDVTFTNKLSDEEVESLSDDVCKAIFK